MSTDLSTIRATVSKTAMDDLMRVNIFNKLLDAVEKTKSMRNKVSIKLYQCADAKTELETRGFTVTAEFADAQDTADNMWTYTIEWGS